MRRVKRKSDSDTQTVIQCMPHVLKQGETAKVLSNQLTQTVVTVSPSVDDIEFYRDLERVDVNLIREDAFQIINYRRYRKLHFRLPSGEEIQFTNSEEQLAGGLTEAEAYDMYVDELITATPLNSPHVTPRGSTVATSTSSHKTSILKSLKHRTSSRTFVSAPVEEVKIMGNTENANDIDIRYAHVQVQTRLMVFPHFLRVTERATVSTDITTQTDVTCRPKCSITELIPKLRSYLQHEGREIVAGDTIANKSILDIIKGLLEAVEDTHKHMFDSPTVPHLPILPPIPSIPKTDSCKPCPKEEPKTTDTCPGECATSPKLDEQNKSALIIEPIDEVEMKIEEKDSNPKMYSLVESIVEDIPEPKPDTTSQVTSQVVSETAEIEQDLSLKEEAQEYFVYEANKDEVTAQLEEVAAQLEQVAAQEVCTNEIVSQVGGDMPSEQGKQLCVNRKNCQDCICSGLKIKLFINNIGLTSADNLGDKTCLLLNILPGLDKIEVQAMPAEQKEESIDEDECDEECCTSKYSHKPAKNHASLILPDGRKTKCPKIIRRLQIKDKDKAVDQPKKAIEIQDKAFKSTTENTDENGSDFGLVIFEETTVSINIQDGEEQLDGDQPTSEDTKPVSAEKEIPLDDDPPVNEDKISEDVQSVIEFLDELVESVTAKKDYKEMNSCNCDDNVFEVIYDKEPKELQNLEFCERKIVKKAKSRELLQSKAFSISNLLDGAIVALVSKNPEGFNVQLNINNNQNPSAPNKQQISNYQDKENIPCTCKDRARPCKCHPHTHTAVCRCGHNVIHSVSEVHLKKHDFSEDEYETCSEGPNSARSKKGQDTKIPVSTQEQPSTVAKLTLPDKTVVNVKVTLDMDGLNRNNDHEHEHEHIKSVHLHESHSLKQGMSLSSVRTGVIPHKSPKYVNVHTKSEISVLGHAPDMSELNSILFTESSRTINILSPSMISNTSYVSLQPIFVQHTASGSKKLDKEKGNVFFSDNIKINSVPSDMPSVFLNTKDVIRTTASKSEPSVQKFSDINSCTTKTCEHFSGQKPNPQDNPCSRKPSGHISDHIAAEPIKSACTLKSCKFTAKPAPEKPDMLYMAFKTCEEELKPIQDAFINLRKELRMLNMPEVDCIFNKPVLPSIDMPRFTPFQKKVRQLNLEDMKKSEQQSYINIKFTPSRGSQCSETNLKTKIKFNYINPDAAPQITPIKHSQNYCFSSYDNPMSKSATHNYGTQMNYDSAYYSYSNSPKTDVSCSYHNRLPCSSSSRRVNSHDSNRSGPLRQTTSFKINLRDLKGKMRPRLQCKHSGSGKSTRFEGVSSHSMCPNISSSSKYSGSSASSVSNVSSRVSSEEFICPSTSTHHGCNCLNTRGKKRKHRSRTPCASRTSSTASVCPFMETTKYVTSPRKKQCSSKDSDDGCNSNFQYIHTSSKGSVRSRHCK